MPATRYKVWGIGGAVGVGVTDSLHVGVAGVAKTSSPTLPHVVVNELVCGRLANVLLLPVPPGFIIEHAAKPYYVSLNFNLAGHDLPPADPAAMMTVHPQVGAGIVAFDAWIVNPDRHRGNIAFDTTTKRVQVFDHSHAFYADNGANLLDHENDLGFTRGHCLANELRAVDGLLMWCDRIQSIPPYYIKTVVESSVDVGLPSGDVQYCCDFLIQRGAKLMDLFRHEQNLFPNIAAPLWTQGVQP